MKKEKLIQRNDPWLQGITKEMKDFGFEQVVIENKYGILKLEYEEK